MTRLPVALASLVLVASGCGESRKDTVPQASSARSDAETEETSEANGWDRAGWGGGPLENVKPGKLFVVNHTDPPQQGPSVRITMNQRAPGVVSAGAPGAAYCLDMVFDTSSLRMSVQEHTEGSEHIWLGTLKFGDEAIESAPGYPLTFKWKKGKGYVYLCGKGYFTYKGKTFRFGFGDSVDIQVPRMKSQDPLEREAAAQALGWLAGPGRRRDKAVSALIGALDDKAMEVRRNAAESLGRVADPRAAPALARLRKAEGESQSWVRDVAEEALGLISVKQAAKKLPDPGAFSILSEALKHASSHVREAAAGALGAAGSRASAVLLTALKDKDAGVREAAVRSLQRAGDTQVLESLRTALASEEDGDVTAALKEVIQGIEQAASGVKERTPPGQAR